VVIKQLLEHLERCVQQPPAITPLARVPPPGDVLGLSDEACGVHSKHGSYVSQSIGMGVLIFQIRRMPSHKLKSPSGLLIQAALKNFN